MQSTGVLGLHNLVLFVSIGNAMRTNQPRDFFWVALIKHATYNGQPKCPTQIVVKEAFSFLKHIRGLMPGLMMEVTLLISLSLQLNCVFQLVSTSDYGRLVNGSWAGVLGMIDNGTADTSILAFR